MLLVAGDLRSIITASARARRHGITVITGPGPYRSEDLEYLVDLAGRGAFHRPSTAPSRSIRSPPRIDSSTAAASGAASSSAWPPTTRHGGSPLSLTGDLDPRLSRWLWLVKMFLAIRTSSFSALWAALCDRHPVAGIALILFTGRYPRALFDFNVGVMRLELRVGFYDDAALGTDRYPPSRCHCSTTRRPSRSPTRSDSPEGWGAEAAARHPHLIVIAPPGHTLMLSTRFRRSTSSAASCRRSWYSVLNLLVVIAGSSC